MLPFPLRSVRVLPLLAAAALTIAARAQDPQDTPSPEALRYVTDGTFLSPQASLRTDLLVSAVSALPRLRKQDPKARREVISALKTRLHEKAGPLADYLGLYPQDRCIRREVAINLDRQNFEEFYRATVQTRESLGSVCRQLKAGKNIEALKAIDALLAASTRSPSLRLHRAITEARLGDAGSAGADLRESRKTPMSAFQAPLEDECLCTAGLKSEARALAQRLQDGERAKDKGIESFLKGDKVAALSQLDEAIRIDPSNLLSLRSRAVVLESSGQPGKAVADYKAALKLARTDVERTDLLLSMSSDQERANDPAGAAQALQDALPLLPSNSPQRVEVPDKIERLRKLVAVAPPLPPALTTPPTRTAEVPPPPPPAAPPVLRGERSSPRAGGAMAILKQQDPASLPRYIRATAALDLLGTGPMPKAIDALTRVVAEYEACSQYGMDALMTREMRTHLAAAYLRTGTRSACQKVDQSPSCLFPNGVQDLRIEPADARKAIAVLEKVLATNIVDLRAQWMLNIAYMALGRYPADVPHRWLLDLGTYRPAGRLGTFTDMAARLGLDIVRNAGGSIIEDFDGDGHLDIMASSVDMGQPLVYFHNNADGSFSDWSARAGLKPEFAGALHIVQTDYDNDGRPDIFLPRASRSPTRALTAEPGSLLLRNEPGGTFVDMTTKAGLAGLKRAQTAIWADYDNDGWLDLLLGDEEDSPKDKPQERTALLYHNNGDGTFSDATPEAGILVSSHVRGAAWIDYDNDGKMDLYLSFYGGQDILYRNQGAGKGRRFKDVTAKAGLPTGQASTTFSAWSWDYDNDGWEDLLVFGFPKQSCVELAAAEALDVEHIRASPHLYRNRGDGTFEDVTRKVGLNRHSMVTMGSNFGDIDNDGYLDFYAGTGAPELTSMVPNRMFRNEGGKSFVEVTGDGGFGLLMQGHGVSFGDVNDDGFQDIHVVMGGNFQTDASRDSLFVNPGNSNHWVTLVLEGTRSNRPALGARIHVRVIEEGKTRDIHRTVTTGSSFGASPFQVGIGLGRASSIDAIEVRWPVTGESQRALHPPMDRFVKIVEGRPGFQILTRNAFKLTGQ